MKNELQPFGRLLSITGKNYLRVLNHRLSNLDIDRNYYALLLIEKGEGKITQQELASMLEIDKVTMLRNIDYLSEKGYVTRIMNESDRRKYSLVLTEKAKRALPEIKKAFIDINDLVMKGLSQKQIAELLSVLDTIKNNLNEYPVSL
jgi:MarR family transcriptional regulator, transcriptional regulator for hemolysin